MRVNQRLLLRNSLAMMATGVICASLAACGASANAAKVPMTDTEIKDFLLQSDSMSMLVDNAGYLAVVTAASAQRDALTKARGAEVDSTDITQVKADGEVTLSALRARIDALSGRTLADEDSRIQTALNKVTGALKGSDKKAITDSLAALNETVTSVESAVSQRENSGSGDGTGVRTSVEGPREETVPGPSGNAGTGTGEDTSDRTQNGRQDTPGGGGDQGSDARVPGGGNLPPADNGPNSPGGGDGGNSQAPDPEEDPLPGAPSPGGDQGGGGEGGDPAAPNPQPRDGEDPQQP